MPYLFSISASLSSLFFILLLSKKEKSTAHYLLASFFMMATVSVLFLFARYQIIDFYLPIFTEINVTMPILYGGIVFLYAKAALDPDFQLQKKHQLIFFLFSLYLATYIWYWHFNVVEFKPFGLFLYSLKPILNIVFLSAMLRFLYKRRRQQLISKAQQPIRLVLLWLGIGGLTICGISLTGILLNQINPNFAPACGDFFIGSFLGIYFFVLGIIAFTKTSIFQMQGDGKIGVLPKKEAKRTIRVTDKKDALLFENLLNFMETNKPFLDAQLSLSKLAILVDLPVSKLSRLINKNGQTNFFDFVNFYRVQEVKSKIINKQFNHLSLLGIALDSGFNSKASFNRLFKKNTGLTPSAYRKKKCADAVKTGLNLPN